MRRFKRTYTYGDAFRRKQMRREALGSVLLLTVVLVLGALCAVAYFHARGGSLR